MGEYFRNGNKVVIIGSLRYSVLILKVSHLFLYSVNFLYYQLQIHQLCIPQVDTQSLKQMFKLINYKMIIFMIASS